MLLVDTYPMRYRHIYEICEQFLPVDIHCRQQAISVRFWKHLLADIHYKHSYCFMVMNNKVKMQIVYDNSSSDDRKQTNLDKV